MARHSEVGSTKQEVGRGKDIRTLKDLEGLSSEVEAQKADVEVYREATYERYAALKKADHALFLNGFVIRNMAKENADVLNTIFDQYEASGFAEDFLGGAMKQVLRVADLLVLYRHADNGQIKTPEKGDGIVLVKKSGEEVTVGWDEIREQRGNMEGYVQQMIEG